MSNVEDFITKARAKHGDRFDYSKVDYINTNTPVIITCKIHGDFLQKPVNHTSKKGKGGCMACNKLKPIHNKMSHEDFIAKCVGVHGNRYGLDNVIYTKANNKIDVECIVHGVFSIRAAHFSSGIGCRKCNQVGGLNNTIVKRDYHKLKVTQTNVYLLNLFDDIYKIGISTNPKNRMSCIKRDTGFDKIKLIICRPYNMVEAFHTEQGLHKVLKDYSYRFNFNWEGHTECFKLNDDQVEMLKIILE